MKIPEVLIAVVSPPHCPPADGDADGAATAAVGGPSKVSIFEALLPYNPPVHDVGWMRMPMMVGGLVIVFGYQYFKGGSAFGAGGKRRAGGRGRGEDDEIASMMQVVRAPSNGNGRGAEARL